MNYGSHLKPGTDEYRLHQALLTGNAYTSAQVRTVTGAGSHTPVITGLRQSLRAAGDPMTVSAAIPCGAYDHPATGRRCKVYAYKLVPRESVEVAA